MRYCSNWCRKKGLLPLLSAELTMNRLKNTPWVERAESENVHFVLKVQLERLWLVGEEQRFTLFSLDLACPPIHPYFCVYSYTRSRRPCSWIKSLRSIFRSSSRRKATRLHCQPDFPTTGNGKKTVRRGFVDERCQETKSTNNNYYSYLLMVKVKRQIEFCRHCEKRGDLLNSHKLCKKSIWKAFINDFEIL